MEVGCHKALCKIGEEEGGKLTVEKKDVMIEKYTSDMFNKMPHITPGHVERIDRCHEVVFPKWKKTVVTEMGIGKQLFLIKDTQWDYDHACSMNS